MRFKITLQRTSGRFLPINYQYELSSAIYKIIEKADSSFAGFLHSEGYKEGYKKFKLFTFSQLDLRPFKLQKEYQRIELLGESVSFIISFMIDKAAESFIKGLFINQEMQLGDAISRIAFTVKSVESLAVPNFKQCMQYKALSPLCLTTKRPESKYAQYLSPVDGEYKEFLIRNLISKYTAHSIAISDGLIESQVNGATMDFKLLNEPQRKKITIKALTSQQTEVVGYLFDFELTAPVGLHEVGYYSGFGEKNSMGFGCGEVIQI
ncbi:MAG TPA: CRISPR-associated endoribonuclease Cas6 [Cytophagales bacterium]|nr:CRISPR-associated endoribonuclease Cas6 [Cytophagales bacterium]